jgi:hypothetical protein
MLITTHADVTGFLAAERRASLLAEADNHRRARRPLAQWRPARFRQPTADRQRVVVPQATGAGQPGRAA